MATAAGSIPSAPSPFAQEDTSVSGLYYIFDGVTNTYYGNGTPDHSAAHKGDRYCNESTGLWYSAKSTSGSWSAFNA